MSATESAANRQRDMYAEYLNAGNDYYNASTNQDPNRGGLFTNLTRNDVNIVANGARYDKRGDSLRIDSAGAKGRLLTYNKDGPNSSQGGGQVFDPHKDYAAEARNYRLQAAGIRAFNSGNYGSSNGDMNAAYSRGSSSGRDGGFAGDGSSGGDGGSGGQDLSQLISTLGDLASSLKGIVPALLASHVDNRSVHHNDYSTQMQGAITVHAGDPNEMLRQLNLLAARSRMTASSTSTRMK